MLVVNAHRNIFMKINSLHLFDDHAANIQVLLLHIVQGSLTCEMGTNVRAWL